MFNILGKPFQMGKCSPPDRDKPVWCGAVIHCDTGSGQGGGYRGNILSAAFITQCGVECCEGSRVNIYRRVDTTTQTTHQYIFIIPISQDTWAQFARILVCGNHHRPLSMSPASCDLCSALWRLLSSSGPTI